jgi:hypothetical protein
MSIEEQRAYFQATLRKAPQGSSRRIWAEAMLKQLDGKAEAGSTPAKPKRGGTR